MPTDPDTGVLAATVAQRFYIDGATKTEIADDLGLSRFKVARLLNLAVAQGIVRFSIKAPLAYDSELARTLAQRFGLRRAVVVRGSVHDQDAAKMRQRVGAAAAAMLSERVTPEDVLGIGWGRTTSAMAHEIGSLAKCTVVQMGGIVGSSSENSLDVVRRVSEIGGGEAYPIFVPLVVSDRATAAGLAQQPSVEAAVARFEAITVATVAVGSWDPPASEMMRSLSDADRRLLSEAGVRAEVLGTFLRADGSRVDIMNERTLAAGYDVLRAIPDLILAAGGADKADAVLAVFRAGLGHTLVTDDALARRLLDLAPDGSDDPQRTPA